MTWKKRIITIALSSALLALVLVGCRQETSSDDSEEPASDPDDGMTAAAMIGGIEKDVDVSLIDDPKSGDWVIVHVGFALNRIDEAEAQETLKALAALAAPSAAAASNDPAAPSADSEEITA